jgi:phosphoglucomutase
VPRSNGAPIGGVKIVTWNGWFAAGPSGTEAVYKIYAKNCKDEQHLQTIVTKAQHSVSNTLGGAG